MVLMINSAIHIQIQIANKKSINLIPRTYIIDDIFISYLFASGKIKLENPQCFPELRRYARKCKVG